METKAIAANVSACNLFSVWLLYKSIFLLARLSSAITSKLQAWFSWNFNTHSLNTAYNAEKILKIGSCANYAGFRWEGHIYGTTSHIPWNLIAIKI